MPKKSFNERIQEEMRKARELFIEDPENKKLMKKVRGYLIFEFNNKQKITQPAVWYDEKTNEPAFLGKKRKVTEQKETKNKETKTKKTKTKETESEKEASPKKVIVLDDETEKEIMRQHFVDRITYKVLAKKYDSSVYRIGCIIKKGKELEEFDEARRLSSIPRKSIKQSTINSINNN